MWVWVRHSLRVVNLWVIAVGPNTTKVGGRRRRAVTSHEEAVKEMMEVELGSAQLTRQVWKFQNNKQRQERKGKRGIGQRFPEYL